MTDSLLMEVRDDGVGVITLNRPAALNAIDMAMAQDFSAALHGFDQDEAVRVIVLAGAGRAFCAGFDINELGTFDAAAMMQAFVTRDPIIHQVAMLAKPVIAALNGVTYGAGALIAAACDLRTGCADTRFKVTATGYGGANATWTLPRIVGPAKAKEILMTGRVVDSDEALRIGLINALGDDALETALIMASAIAANPPTGVQGVKRLIDDGHGRTIEEAYHAEFAWMIESLRTTDQAGAKVFKRFLGGDS